MALQTQTFDSAVSSNGYTLRLTLVENSTDVNANTSSVTYTLTLLSGKDHSFAMYAVGYNVTLNGTAVVNVARSGAPQLSLGLSSSLQLATGTVSIAHNSDGAKTMSVAFSIDMAKDSRAPGAMSVSGKSMVLTAIPRASSFTVPTFTLGTAGNITISRASSSFTHTLTWKFGSLSGTIATKTAATSVSWTPALSMATAIPNATSGTGTITCQTYNGDTLVGATSKSFTANVPASVAPTCAIAVADGTGNASAFGGYIQGISTAKITVTATKAQGSDISAYSVTANGNTYSSATPVTGVLTKSGTNTITAKVTDKRGRSGSASVSITVLAYSPPAVSALSVRRCDADGTANDQGEYCQITFSGSITSLSGKNTAKWTLKYRQVGSTGAYTSVQMSTAYAPSSVSKVFAAASSYSWEIILEGADAFKTATKSTTLSTGAVIMHFRADGNGVGFGKVGELANTLDVGWALRIRKNLQVDGDMSVGGYSLVQWDRDYRAATEIPENADLNDYKTPGVYYCKNAATTATLQNAPSDIGAGFRMEVWSVMRTTYIHQIIYPTVPHAVYLRNCENSPGVWYKYPGTAM